MSERQSNCSGDYAFFLAENDMSYNSTQFMQLATSKMVRDALGGLPQGRPVPSNDRFDDLLAKLSIVESRADGHNLTTR
jgi:hypothetical protein